MEGREVHCEGKGLCLAISHLPVSIEFTLVHAHSSHLRALLQLSTRNLGGVLGSVQAQFQLQLQHFAISQNTEQVTKVMLIHLQHTRGIIAILGQERSCLGTSHSPAVAAGQGSSLVNSVSAAAQPGMGFSFCQPALSYPEQSTCNHP